MTCELYNVVKEGDLRNVVASGIHIVEAIGINSLYDGDSSTIAYVVSGTSGQQITHLQQVFGETYDLCYMRYHTDEATLGDIVVSFETFDSSTTVAGSLESPGVYRYEFNQPVRTIDIRHTITSGTVVSVYQLEVIAQRNETLGFGTSPSAQLDYYRADHSTANALSSSVNKVPIFNDNHFDEIARVSVAPTFTDADNYIHVATTESGTFYGINEFGFTQPGPHPIGLVDDNFTSTSLNEQWVKRVPAQPHTATPTQEGFVFDLDWNSNIQGSSTSETTGIFSKEFFTANSFVAEIKIRFLDLRNVALFDTEGRNWFFVLTNSFPIPDIGYEGFWPTDKRRGTSVVGLNMYPPGINPSPSVNSIEYQLRWVDGSPTNDPRDLDTFDKIENRWTFGDGGGLDVFTPKGEVESISGPTMSELEDIVGNGFLDFTSSAEWHTWKITWDHVEKSMSAFVDNVNLGTRKMRVEALSEACKLFVGFQGNGGVKWAIKDFRILPDKVYRQRNIAVGATASATISGAVAINAIDGSQLTTYAAPSPNDDFIFRVDFDKPKDVVYYRLKQKAASTLFSAYGQTYGADFGNTAIVDFGGVKREVHTYTNTSSFVTRSPTFSGTATTVSGISYLSFNFVDYDQASQADHALAIDELEIYAEEIEDAPSAGPIDGRKIPWSEGRWVNLNQYGNTNALSLRSKDYILPASVLTPEYLLVFSDFGFSSARNQRQFADNVHDYHHAESLFSSPGATADGDYVQWHSASQSDGHIYIWRYFTEESLVSAIYWDSNTNENPNVANRFKFQYLIDGGNPNNESDWFNFPVITRQHAFTGGTNSADTNYKNYKNYLITNHNGEFYTNYGSLPNFGAGFSVSKAASGLGVPRDLAVPNDYMPAALEVRFGVVSTANGLHGYIEFDAPIATRGVRMVVNSVVDGAGGDIGAPRTRFALEALHIFRTNGAGSYASPIFDTGTSQNTERLFAKTDLRENTEIKLFVRSSDTAPLYAYDPDFEVWEAFGSVGSAQDEVDGGGNSSNRTRAISVGNLTYFMLDEAPYAYDNDLDTWSIVGGGYPATGGGSTSGAFEEDTETAGVSSEPAAITPDDSVEENIALLDNKIFVACISTGDVRTPRLMYYDLSGDFWFVIRDNRPPFSEDSVMVPYEEEKKLFFFNQDGTVSSYDVTLNVWRVEDAIFPTGTGSRFGMATTVFEGKVYLLGGRSPASGGTGTATATIFNLATRSFTSGTLAPEFIVHGQAVVVPEERVIYVFPVSGDGGSGWHTTMKYFPDEDRWDVCESLMWARDKGTFQDQLGTFHYYYDGYIYRYISGLLGRMRTKVSRTDWQHGKIADFRDPVWGGREGLSIPWKKLGVFGELMPQERYFQFRAELHSYDRINSPVLESITIVTPQDILVPASGVANAYVKIGVTSDETYQAWYTGTYLRGVGLNPPDTFGNNFSCLYTRSENGKEWNFATVASGIWDPNVGGSFSGNQTASSAWAVKNSVADYQFWFTRNVSNSANNSAEIYYATADNPEDFSGEVKVIAKNLISSSANGAAQPCVLKENPTSYTMWYTGLSSTNVKRIIRATSTNGIVWTDHSVVVNVANDPVGHYDDGGAYRPSVIKEDGLYRLWYAGVGSDGLERVLYSQSADGITWERPLLNVPLGSEGRLDTRATSRPFVLKDEDLYVLYYVGSDGTDHSLIRAESPDGLEWFNHRLVIPPGGLVEYLDGNGVYDFFALVNRDPVISRTYITSGKLKLYNAGGAL